MRRGPSRDERGAVAVEFVLMAPILLLVLFAVISYGRLFSEISVMTSAAREGGRVAALRGSSGEVQSAVASAADPYTVSGPISVSTTCTEENRGAFVTISWTQSFTAIKESIPLPLPMPGSRLIKGVFRCE